MRLSNSALLFRGFAQHFGKRWPSFLFFNHRPVLVQQFLDQEPVLVSFNVLPIHARHRLDFPRALVLPARSDSAQRA